MNFAHNYINNINELKQLLIEDCVRNSLIQGEENTIFIDEVELDNGIGTLHFLNDSKQPFCKIEYTDKGIHFYEKKDTDKSKHNV